MRIQSLKKRILQSPENLTDKRKYAQEHGLSYFSSPAEEKQRTKTAKGKTE